MLFRVDSIVHHILFDTGYPLHIYHSHNGNYLSPPTHTHITHLQPPPPPPPRRPSTITMVHMRRRNPMFVGRTTSFGCPLLLFVVLLIIGMATTTTVMMMVVVVQAYPSGAGSCPGNEPAVGGSHANSSSNSSSGSSSKVIQSSSLLDNDFLVTINDTIVTTATALNPTFHINTPYTISVYNNRFMYRGILIRVELPTTTSTSNTTTEIGGYLSPSTNTQSSFSCMSTQPSNVMGITHVNSTFKSIHSGILEIQQPANITLDITVVGVNNDTISLYAYDRLHVTFVDPETVTDRPPTRSPVVATTPVTNNPTTTTKPPTTRPSINNNNTDTDDDDDDLVLAPSPGRLRKTVNTTADDNDTEEYSSFLGENIQVQLSYILSSSLTDGEIRAYERITSAWYSDFYNSNFVTVFNTTTNQTDIMVVAPNRTTTAAAAAGAVDNIFMNRKLTETSDILSLSNNYGIVMGSMTTTINVTNVTYAPYKNENDKDVATGNSTTKTVIQITYSQMITYRRRKVSGNTTMFSQQYLTIPYRSRIGRQLFVEAFIDSNIYAFSQLNDGDISSTSTLSVPMLVGPPSQPLPTTTTTDSKEKLANGYIAIIVIGSISAVIALILMYQHRTSTSNKDVTNDDVAAGELLAAEQRQLYADDDDARKGLNGFAVHEESRVTKSIAGSREYVIYAPAGRLGIVLDDPSVLRTGPNSDLKQYGPVISMIKEGSPLMNESEMNVGDMIVAVDDVDVRNMTPQKVSKLINDRSKHPIRRITCVKIPNMIQTVNVPE